MDTSAVLKVALLGLVACNGFSQTAPFEDPLANRSLKVIGVPVLEPPAREYQNFFDEVQYLGHKPLSADARKALHLTDQEIRSLVTITADLAAESEFFRNTVRPYVLESRLEAVESGSIAPSLRQKLNELRDQWTVIVLDHAHQLKTAFGDERFRRVEEFIHSGRSMFEKAPSASSVPNSN